MINLLLFLILPLLGLGAGIFLANSFTLTIGEDISIFLAVALVLSLDMLVEATARYLSNKFSLRSMLLTYLLNLLFAYFLLTIGNLMRVDLYIALFIVFGIKLFSNLSYISQKFFSKLQF
jgi:small basic protein